MDDVMFEDGVDGIHGLRRRERTRLWYRALPPAETLADAARAAAQYDAYLSEGGSLAAVEPEISQDVIDTFLDEWTAEATVPASSEATALTTDERRERLLRRLGTFHDITPVDRSATVAPVVERTAITAWRNVPRTAPTLLLAQSPLLDRIAAGAVLAPGTAFRVLSAEDGVVEVEVMAEDGVRASGYCNAIDLACIDPMIVHLAGVGRRLTTKERLGRIGRGIGHVTGSLMGHSS